MMCPLNENRVGCYIETVKVFSHVFTIKEVRFSSNKIFHIVNITDERLISISTKYLTFTKYFQNK